MLLGYMLICKTALECLHPIFCLLGLAAILLDYLGRQTIINQYESTADGDCSHEIKRHLLLGRKVMSNLDSILKSRDITLPTKVRLVKARRFFQWSCMVVRVGW